MRPDKQEWELADEPVDADTATHMVHVLSRLKLHWAAASLEGIKSLYVATSTLSSC